MIGPPVFFEPHRADIGQRRVQSGAIGCGRVRSGAVVLRLSTARSIESVTANPVLHTRDLGGSATTAQVTTTVCRLLANPLARGPA